MAALSSTSLEYFVAAADHPSFTDAARAVGISQPSLSVAMKKLEEELHTTLFSRDRRGTTLTATGEALLVHARAALRVMEEARNEVASLENDPRGAFVLGAHESLAAYALPRFMVGFLAAYPQIRLSLWNGNSRDVQRAVVAREVDLGLVVNPEQHDDCVIQMLFADRVELVAAAALVERLGDDVLTGAPLIYVPELVQVQSILGRLRSVGLSPSQHLPCSSMELVKSLVVDGLGVGILPYRVATHGVSPGTLVRLPAEMPAFEDTISLVRRYDMHETRASRILLDALREHGRSMAE